MTSKMFDLFPRLPTELRLKIWKEACRTISPNEYGIQYIDFRRDGVAPLPCNWSQASTEQSPRGTNSSAYLIDGGLWTACKESREVIVKHTYYDFWMEVQHEAISEKEPFRWYCHQENLSRWEKVPIPATIDLETVGQRWHMLAYPQQDIFCIKAKDWKSTRKELRKYQLSINIIEKVAFEFDQMWMQNLPKEFSTLTRERKSARGCWARRLYDALGNNQPDLWIIDKSAKWIRCSNQNYDTIYHDCEGEYVEVKWKDVFDHIGDGTSASASAFIKSPCLHWGQVDEHLQWELWRLRSLDYLVRRFHMQDFVKLLVRRDNEVMPPQRRCRKECYDIGWCVCHGGEGSGKGLF
ncbi:uncharacterized protein B0J16DRAFT_314620 [Fusarium flagelliforme]|uniref:uncharacterized protein n=1 Tax=Fusarium flagelliforme TaxID=2675880 RepID=UPI001E8E8488|nr:uncharacterized protein B0J16DRAFT_314620 [Fusarium flagelliforme]KAH7198314.1 hypothetical protein B0J16DRAFT_314620 [Fusarium flagelliforme]